MLGGLLMLLYLSVDALLHRQRWANPEILLGTAVYGNYAIWHGNGKVILAGFGLQLVLAGVAGIVCGLIYSVMRGDGLTGLLTALAVASVWYVLWYLLLFPSFAPLIPLYAPRTPTLASHVLLGIVMSRIPALQRKLVPPQVPPALPFTQEQQSEVINPASTA